LQPILLPLWILTCFCGGDALCCTEQPVSDTYAERYGRFVTRGPAHSHTRSTKEQKQQEAASQLDYPVLVAEPLEGSGAQVIEMATGTVLLLADGITSIYTPESAKRIVAKCVQESGMPEFKIIGGHAGGIPAVIGTYPQSTGIAASPAASEHQFHPLLDALDLLLCLPYIFSCCCAISAVNREASGARSDEGIGSDGVVLAEQMVRGTATRL
jgi:hypothetical protein